MNRHLSLSVQLPGCGTHCIVGPLTIIVLVATANVSFGQTMAASELNERVSSAIHSIKNISFQVTWIDSIEGHPKKHRIVKSVSDSLGRVRMTELELNDFDVARSKTRSRDGRHDKLFDGEKSVVLTVFEGQYPNGKAIEVPGKITRNAVIVDAKDGISRWRNSDRSPLTFGLNLITHRLKRLASLHQAVDLERKQYGGEEAIVARFHQDDHDFAVTMLPRRSWAIYELIEKNDGGKVMGEYHAEYVSTDDMLWIPLRGTFEFQRPKVSVQFHPPKPGKDGVPATQPPTITTDDSGVTLKHEWKFEVSDIRVNDPNFDESVFAVLLPEQTRVTDRRYDAVYRVGDTKAADADLASLARKAKEAASVGNLPARTKVSRSVVWMTVGTVALVVVLAGAAIARRRALRG